MTEDTHNWNVRLHPDLAHFAHNWRLRIPWSSRRYKQTKLEDYGFHSSLPQYEPWEPTDNAPSIPIEWLLNFPQLAFELTREGCMYSVAAVPPLLNVCAESRQALKKIGYRLAFATRTAGPRTWFNYKLDLLYLPSANNAFPWSPYESYRLGDASLPVASDCSISGTLLSGCSWDIGQLSLRDLREVKFLVLGRGRAKLWETEAMNLEMQNILPLFSNLEEIYFEHWSVNDFTGWFSLSSGCSMLKAHSDWTSPACLPAEDIDLIGSIYWTRQLPFYWLQGEQEYWPGLFFHVEGVAHTFFNHMKDRSSRPLFEVLATNLAKSLKAWKESPGSPKNCDVLIPTFRHVHLISKALSTEFLTNRYRFWNLYRSLDGNLIRQPDQRMNVSDAYDLSPPFRINWDIIRRLERSSPGLFDTIERSHAELELVDKGNWSLLQVWYLDRFVINEPSVDYL